MGKKKTGAAGGLVEQIAELDRKIEASKKAQREWLAEEKPAMRAAAQQVKDVRAKKHALRQDMLQLCEQRNELLKKLENQKRGRRGAAEAVGVGAETDPGAEPGGGAEVDGE